MKNGRIFVTTLAIMGAIAVTACSKGSHKAEQKRTSRSAQNKALIQQGQSLLSQTDTLRKELDETYKIWIRDSAISVAAGVTRDHKTVGRDYNWERLSLIERQAAKEKLAALMTGLTKVLEIDAKKRVWVENLSKVKDRKAATESFQISLSNFEMMHGELYNPSTAGSGFVYRNF